MYSIDSIVDQVYLAVTGGVPSDDINVDRDDIRHLAPAAISEACDKHVKIQLNEAVQDWREFGLGREGLAQDLWLNYDLTLEKDTTRNLSYVTLPGKVTYLPGNRGLMQAFISGGEFNVRFQRVGSFADIVHMPVMTGVVQMWVEKGTTAAKVYFRGLGLPKPDSVVIRACLTADSFGDGDELPITDQAAMDAVRILTEYFTMQRQMPEDVTNTGVDEKI